MVLCMSCCQASHRPGSQHARTPTRHQAPSVQSARHGCQLLHVCRLHVACVPRIGAGVNYLPPFLLPPAPIACRGQDQDQELGPPIDLGQLKRGCDHGLRRALLGFYRPMTTAILCLGHAVDAIFGHESV